MVQIAALQLPFQHSQTYTLGDNREVEVDVYLATVLWDGKERDIAVLVTVRRWIDRDVHVLRGHHLFIDVIDGGEVRINTRSS